MSEHTNDLATYSICIFLLGIFVGLLCHYTEYGWNPNTPLWGKIAGIVATCYLAVQVIVRFRVLSKVEQHSR